MPARFTPPPTLSLAAWLALDEDEPGELVDGRLEPEELPTPLHELTISWLIHALRTWLVPRGGFVLGSNTKLVISSARGRKPDVLAYLGRHARGAAPDIVIEVVGTTQADQRRDRIYKKADYASLGVPQYWLLDPNARTLDVLALDSDRRFIPILSTSTGTHDVPRHPGLRLDLDALWSELDRGTAFFSSHAL